MRKIVGLALVLAMVVSTSNAVANKAIWLGSTIDVSQSAGVDISLDFGDELTAALSNDGSFSLFKDGIELPGGIQTSGNVGIQKPDGRGGLCFAIDFEAALENETLVEGSKISGRSELDASYFGDSLTAEITLTAGVGTAVGVEFCFELRAPRLLIPESRLPAVQRMIVTGFSGRGGPNTSGRWDFSDKANMRISPKFKIEPSIEAKVEFGLEAYCNDRFRDTPSSEDSFEFSDRKMAQSAIDVLDAMSAPRFIQSRSHGSKAEDIVHCIWLARAHDDDWLPDMAQQYLDLNDIDLRLLRHALSDRATERQKEAVSNLTSNAYRYAERIFSEFRRNCFLGDQVNRRWPYRPKDVEAAIRQVSIVSPSLGIGGGAR